MFGGGAEEEVKAIQPLNPPSDFSLLQQVEDDPNLIKKPFKMGLPLGMKGLNLAGVQAPQIFIGEANPNQTVCDLNNSILNQSQHIPS